MFYILRLTLFIVITIPLALLTMLLGCLDRHGKLVYRINQFWAWLLLRMGGISLNVEGQENIDTDQQYIFMVNHQSNVDIPVIVQSLARFQLRWIAKKELLWVPFFGWAMWATKHITVDRSDPQSAVRSLERAKEKIAAGISVVSINYRYSWQAQMAGVRPPVEWPLRDAARMSPRCSSR